MSWSRRELLAMAGTTAATITAGCLGGSESYEQPSGPVVNAPIPSKPGKYTYARMGTDDANVTATYFGNWKCPFCADFSTGFLGDLVSEYVEPGDVAIEYRCLAYLKSRQGGFKPFLGPDAPNAARAGLAVWRTDPDAYWSFHELVMQNQPPESKQWATKGKLASMAEAAGVSNVDPLKRAVSKEKYEQTLRKTTTKASQLGVQGTPTLAIDGSLVNGLKKDAVRNLLDDAIANSG